MLLILQLDDMHGSDTPVSTHWLGSMRAAKAKNPSAVLVEDAVTAGLGHRGKNLDLQGFEPWTFSMLHVNDAKQTI